MNFTELFYREPYTFAGEVRAISCTPAADGQWQVVLEETFFYPEGGGQPADLGEIGPARVLDVKWQQDTIVHLTDRPLPVDIPLPAALDKARRLDHMQQHSGEHLISGLVKRDHGWRNVGFGIGSAVTTIDFDGVLTPEDIDRIERLANEAVWENIPIEILYPDQETLADLDYRSKLELDSTVRLVRIGELDLCACCGTQLARTGEIGPIKIVSQMRYKKGVRLSMVCGQRALADHQFQTYQAAALSSLLSRPVHDLTAGVVQLQQQLDAYKLRMAELERAMAEEQAEQLAALSEPVIHFETLLSEQGLRQLSQRLQKRGVKNGYLFRRLDEQKFQALIFSDCPDLKAFGKRLAAALNGAGGGRSGHWQGTVQASEDEIRAFLGTASPVG